jgi:hypothetical protein
MPPAKVPKTVASTSWQATKDEWLQRTSQRQFRLPAVATPTALPDDVLREILDRADKQVVGRLAQVAKRLASLAGVPLACHDARSFDRTAAEKNAEHGLKAFNTLRHYEPARLKTILTGEDRWLWAKMRLESSERMDARDVDFFLGKLDIDIQHNNVQGETLLADAVLYRHASAVTALLRRGADATAENASAIPPWAFAIRDDAPDILSMILRAVRGKLVTSQGKTPLHFCAEVRRDRGRQDRPGLAGGHRRMRHGRADAAVHCRRQGS